MKNRMLKAAREYAQWGWPVFPVHSATNGQCSCGDETCKSVAKHPRTPRGFKDATANEKKIESWWTKWPGANIGIATGGESGLLVLDIDPRNGGDQSLEKLPELPDTPAVRTGGGGAQFYFKLSPGTKMKSRSALLPGLDIKAEGGYVVAPPSSHKSGKRYLWYADVAPEEVKLASIPQWLARLLADQRREPAVQGGQTDQTIVEGQRNTSLLKMAGALRRQGATPEVIADALLVVNQNQCDPLLPEKEVLSIAQSSASWSPMNGRTNSPPYEADEDGIFWLKTTRDGPMPTRLTNFNARIRADVVEDDGVEIRRTYEIEAELSGRRKSFLVQQRSSRL